MRKDTPLERLYNGIIKENPTFVMMPKVGFSFMIPL